MRLEFNGNFKDLFVFSVHLSSFYQQLYQKVYLYFVNKNNDKTDLENIFDHFFNDKNVLLVCF